MLSAGGEAGTRRVLEARCAQAVEGKKSPVRSESSGSGVSSTSGGPVPARPAGPSGDRFSDVTFLTVAEVAALMRVSKMTVRGGVGRLLLAGDSPTGAYAAESSPA